jgi:hypothetical protein
MNRIEEQFVFSDVESRGVVFRRALGQSRGRSLWHRRETVLESKENHARYRAVGHGNDLQTNHPQLPFGTEARERCQ